MTSDHYQPIDCSVHDRLEHLAVRRIVCTIRFEDEVDGERQARGRIHDIFARDGQEFLRLDGGETIRLDRLKAVVAEE